MRVAEAMACTSQDPMLPDRRLGAQIGTRTTRAHTLPSHAPMTPHPTNIARGVQWKTPWRVTFGRGPEAVLKRGQVFLPAISETSIDLCTTRQLAPPLEFCMER
eukprot:CAMPEP_0194496258 /NCGR_PEP_ID=MMETSP0253-20130528/13594_1 /TAXON_ID=2966 /ORGANISM="Noctiluca scintillans" /LENGTH=103 /DNA_ID=CAMNT_0039337633 /DNA_START=271 /DNA_END=578 /DNA_ORIENTATION=-